MNKIKLVYALTLAFTLTGALPGCATYEKCGLDGCPGDAKITANVQAQLAQHEDIGPRVHVQTLNGVVYLNGNVSAGLQRDTAESVASHTPGVAKVVDDIYIVH
ncbi:MAG: BON domain-containing protein [Steroidobacteraceae bacterium]